MSHTVIYTVLTGGYDRLAQPEIIRPGYDYICFTDAGEGRDGAWELRPIPFETPDPITRARYPKLQPHVVLPGYDYSVFMDANLCISGEDFYEAVEKAMAEKVLYASLPHPERDCVYDELRYCYLKDKLSTCAAFRHHRRLKASGMPRHFGLFESNIILRAHNTPAVIALDDAWWADYQRCCTRDQLTLTPVLYRLGLPTSLLFGPGRCARNVPFVRYTLHPPSGKENTPGRLTWGNVRYRLRLAWRRCCLLFLK